MNCFGGGGVGGVGVGEKLETIDTGGEGDDVVDMVIVQDEASSLSEWL